MEEPDRIFMANAPGFLVADHLLLNEILTPGFASDAERDLIVTHLPAVAWLQLNVVEHIELLKLAIGASQPKRHNVISLHVLTFVALHVVAHASLGFQRAIAHPIRVGRFRRDEETNKGAS